MANQSFYVSIDGESARHQKTELLNAQIDILNMMERLQTLHDMRLELQGTKEKLRKTMNVVKSNLKQLDNDVPEFKEMPEESHLRPISDDEQLESEGYLPKPTKEQLKQMVQKSAMEKRQNTLQQKQMPTYSFSTQAPKDQKQNALQEELSSIRDKLKRLNG